MTSTPSPDRTRAISGSKSSFWNSNCEMGSSGLQLNCSIFSRNSLARYEIVMPSFLRNGEAAENSNMSKIQNPNPKHYPNQAVAVVFNSKSFQKSVFFPVKHLCRGGHPHHINKNPNKHVHDGNWNKEKEANDQRPHPCTDSASSINKVTLIWNDSVEQQVVDRLWNITEILPSNPISFGHLAQD